MPFPLPPRTASVLAGALAAIAIAIAIAVGGCSHVAPLGPEPTATMPQPRQLGSPIILQAVLGQPDTPSTDACPVGYVALSGIAADDNGWCYSKLGAPVTITAAGVSAYQPRNPSGQPAGPPGAANLMINLPAADAAELTAITTKAYQARGYVDVSVAGKTWAIEAAMAPLTHGQFAISLPNSTLALQLQHLLFPPS
jgi:hypothetical protein